jgi:hypothetical protein
MSDASASASSSTLNSPGKICISCGTSVAGAKRMKDSKGQYWCYDCGLADERKKRGDDTLTDQGGALTGKTDTMSQCPLCRQFFSPVDMIRSERAPKKSGGYICLKCHHKPKGKKKKSSGGGGFLADMDEEKRKKVIYGIVAGVVLVPLALYFNRLLPI